MNAIMIVLIILAFALTMWAQFKVKGTFKKWSTVPTSSGLTGYQAARRMLDNNGLHDIPIEPVAGALTDHYDPINRVVRLSEPVYYETSISAISVACHEIGHAIQHKESYPFLVARHKIFPIVNFASGVAPFLLIAGFLFNQLGLAQLGVIFFACTVLFQVITLPVEFNASNRARDVMISEGFIRSDEERGVAKVLNSAALTYVAAALLSLLELIRYVMIVTQSRD